jgi:hypothetical protein
MRYKKNFKANGRKRKYLPKIAVKKGKIYAKGAKNRGEQSDGQ